MATAQEREVKVRLIPHAAVLAGALLALPAAAQQPVYQTPPDENVRFRADLLLRQEWFQDVFLAPGQFEDDSRRRLQVRPRLELGGGALQLGVGGEFNYSSDRNVEPPPGLLRDNYDSRGARLDLAYLRVEPISGVRLEGGRFVMPVALTEMIWDKDLRPQGAAVRLGRTAATGGTSVSATGLWARGSHPFDDDETDMLLGSVELVLPAGNNSTFELVGSYIEWREAGLLEAMIRRQNTRVAGRIVRDYKVVDLVARLRTSGQMPMQLVADLSWNTAVDDQKRGLWLSAVLGAIRASLLRVEYTFAQVDRDATLAAYGTDDFFWVTGWEGHRLDVGTSGGPNSSLHVVGQLQRFKDSARVEEREHWLKRLRVELRVSY